MKAELLAGVAGALLSLGFSYIPGLNEKYAGLDRVRKSAIMAGLLALTALGTYGLSCTSWAAGWGINVTCDQAGMQTMIQAFLTALVANQGVYMISPGTPRVEAAKAARG